MNSKDRIPSAYHEGTHDWQDQYDMLLDDGITCKYCVHVERCCAIFGQRPYVNDGQCQFYPNRFRANNGGTINEPRR